MPTNNEIRQQFIDFFVSKHGHVYVPSSPVVPFDDPTLLFANAGMNQFKDVFLGTGKRPYQRVANSQKCIRAGGKHNDLEDVGRDTYHHTFFEMLGNWSFGDYFKKEAITWAWELLTEVWGLDKTRLHATVFEGDPANNLGPDTEADQLWKSQTTIPHGNVHLGGKKDNFWDMGDTGPCGPCTEIHIDLTDDKSGGRLVNQGSPHCIEIWNLVFIQFNRNSDASLTPLPAKHVDTGMGFERVAAVLQGKKSNYDTDVFSPLFEKIQSLSGSTPYKGSLENRVDIAYRVVADHIRALTFALTDGAAPSNEKRGYVLRSILRRAERFGRQYLGFKKPFLHELAQTLANSMGDVFPELRSKPGAVAKVIHEEEESFLRTMEKGMKLFQDISVGAQESGDKVISGDKVFDLHTTYGFFPEITAQMAGESGLEIDWPGYKTLFEKFKEESGKDRKSIASAAIQGELPSCDDSPKYSSVPCQGKVLGWVLNNAVIREGKLQPGVQTGLLLDQSGFYAEQGGQVGDSGEIRFPGGCFVVSDTQKLGAAILHLGKLEQGILQPGQEVTGVVSPKRGEIKKNHTSTHLLNSALREILGDHVDQKGSLVDENKTRFDFSHSQALTREEIRKIELRVNEMICAGLPVVAETMPLDAAKKLPGVRAMFGEKYPDPVRVVRIGGVENIASMEFCGGSHLDSTSQAGFFKILGQESVSKGVRRITAVTGQAAVEHLFELSGVLEVLSEKFRCSPLQVVERVNALQDENKELKAQAKQGTSSDLAGVMDQLLASSKIIGPCKFLCGQVPVAPVDQIRQHLDRVRQKAGSSVVLIGWGEGDKAGLMAAVSDDLQAQGIEAGKLIAEVAPLIDGKGGGPKGMAQAGGKSPGKLKDAFDKGFQIVSSKLA
ncbi:MAG: alanine--tRNA ligase [Gemmataceae bacterium]|nr:alanine--tRNA ligase [Gemmataceae bacterium]